MVANTVASIGMSCRPPIRRTFRSSSTRRSFACRSSRISPISSRRIEPPYACSKIPFFSALASVNAPFSCPKSSLSINCSGRAAQLIPKNGAKAAESPWCIS